MVKTVLVGVNKVERGLFNYSPDRMSPIKPSLYGVYASSFFCRIPVENFYVDSTQPDGALPMKIIVSKYRIGQYDSHWWPINKGYSTINLIKAFDFDQQ